jgi:AP-1-like factor
MISLPDDRWFNPANMQWQGYDTSYGANGFMTYPAYPMGYPTHNESVAPVGLIPVELEIEGLYEDYDRRRRKNGSEKIVSSHVHSVGDPIVTM